MSRIFINRHYKMCWSQTVISQLKLTPTPMHSHTYRKLTPCILQSEFLKNCPLFSNLLPIKVSSEMKNKYQQGCPKCMLATDRASDFLKVC